MSIFYHVVATLLILAEYLPWLVLTASVVSINKCPGSSLGNRLYVPASAVNSLERVTFRLRNEFKACKNELHFASELRADTSLKSNDTIGEIGLKTIDMSYFTTDGLLRHGSDYYYPEEYCISSFSGGNVKATVCKPLCKRNRPCIRKCCPIGEVMDMESAGCKPAGGKLWSPVLYTNETHNLSDEEREKIRPHFINLPPSCKYSNGSASEEYSSIPLRPLRVNEYQLETIPMRLLKDGSLIYYAITDKWETIPKDLFCIDGMQNFGEVKSYTGLPSDQIVFSCVDYYTANVI
ncbi:unnamed protein product [Allacma fusca]|uniref:Methuselah N-terminal domain-containing protein n=1 Tax=Allacma fusca TaxID=39272 RepID=A0A8J2Q0F8_9HEXA|nr:unnamed protein product [Allacma fusca]